MERVLELMLKSAEERNQTMFNNLNILFEKTYPPLKFNDYDLFRQSCFCCFQFPELYLISLNDAKQRLKLIHNELSN